MFPGKTKRSPFSVLRSPRPELRVRAENCDRRTGSGSVHRCPLVGAELTAPAAENGERRTENPPRRRVHAATLALLAIIGLSACRAPQKMAENPAYKPYESSRFFDDGMSARTPVPGTVARGTLREDTLLYPGKVGGQFANAFPFEVTRADVERGKQRFEIYCTPCHGATGAGDGMIVQRGYRRPPSYHSDRLRQVPAGYFFDVMTNGFGVMQDYRSQITARDRWAVVAYVRALQLSQHATIADVPEAERGSLDRPAGVKPGEESHR